METQRRRYRAMTRSLLAASLLCAAPWTWAVDAGGPADAPQDTTPAGVAPPPTPAQALPEPQMAAQPGFVLQGVAFDGVTGVPESELQAAVAGRIGTRVTFADLEQLAARATEVYRRHGYALVQVFVPVQEVIDGRVRFSVVEGMLGDVSIDIDEAAPVGRERVARTLAVLEPGKPLNGRRYERAMLLLSDLPGIRPQSAISAGAVSGATDLTVKVGAVERLSFGLQLDNHGSRDSGRHRLTGSMRWASPSGRGDNLDLRLMAAEGLHTAFGRLSYETPVGYSGLRIGGGVARVQYELGGPFAPLEPTGVGDVADLSFSHPLIRQRNTNLFLRGALDHKDLTDRFKAVGFESRKRIRGVSLGFSLEKRDRFLGGGYSSASGQVYRGNLDIRDALSEGFDRPPLGYGTQGDFTKYTLQLARLQHLAPKLSLFLGTGFQWAGNNLDTYERLSLGGPKAVRAYATGEVLVDEGWIAALELRYALRPDTALFLFHDAARGDLHHRPLPSDSVLSRSLRGSGIGLHWGKPGNVAMSLTLAWRGSGPGLIDQDRNPRLFWSLQKAF